MTLLAPVPGCSLPTHRPQRVCPAAWTLRVFCPRLRAGQSPACSPRHPKLLPGLALPCSRPRPPGGAQLQEGRQDTRLAQGPQLEGPSWLRTWVSLSPRVQTQRGLVGPRIPGTSEARSGLGSSHTADRTVVWRPHPHNRALPPEPMLTPSCGPHTNSLPGESPGGKGLGGDCQAARSPAASSFSDGQLHAGAGTAEQNHARSAQSPPLPGQAQSFLGHVSPCPMPLEGPGTPHLCEAPAAVATSLQQLGHLKPHGGVSQFGL